MIDPVQLPILMKAIDFVFEEGRKILEERRERRKLDNAASPSADPEPAKDLSVPEAEKETKQDLLASKVDEILWQSHEDEIKHDHRPLGKRQVLPSLLPTSTP